MLTVVKVGGSLFDWPELKSRLKAWLDVQDGRVLLVPGGGRIADDIRELDRCQGLGEEISHWLALQALTLNGHFLEKLLGAPMTMSPRECEHRIEVLDAFAFLRADEGKPGCLPHVWSATSDSVAARAAVVSGADRLVLLKSTSVPAGITWEDAGRQGFVDGHFGGIVRQAGNLAVTLINFRARALPAS